MLVGRRSVSLQRSVPLRRCPVRQACRPSPSRDARKPPGESAADPHRRAAERTGVARSAGTCASDVTGGTQNRVLATLYRSGAVAPIFEKLLRSMTTTGPIIGAMHLLIRLPEQRRRYGALSHAAPAL